MNPQALLDELAPLRTPAPIPWWPPAPGWWLMGTMILGLLLVLSLWLLKRRRRNRYRRTALAALDRLTNGSATAADLNRLLKATALRGFGDQVAALHGDAWLQFLVNSCPKRLDPTVLQPLAAVYAPETPTADTVLTDAIRTWIRHHEVDHV